MVLIVPLHRHVCTTCAPFILDLEVAEGVTDVNVGIPLGVLESWWTILYLSRWVVLMKTINF